jgi:RNA polymerase sigma-70 factor (ECF subfamily)
VPRPQPNPAASFGEAVLAEVDALYNFALRLTGRPADAEDLVQESVTRAIAAQAQFRPHTSLRSWLFRILRNLHIDGVRRARGSPFAATLSSDEAGADAVPAELLRGDAELEQLRGLVAEDIEAALGELNEEARSVILLDFEGFSEAEIALVMGTAQGTVKSRLSRARAQLRSKLAGYSK